jgi:nucleotide-binding universal stress UspA family protein
MRPSARILLALDQLASGETKIPVATHYAKMMGAQIVLLHVLPPRALDPGAVRPGEAFARTYLDAVVAQIQAAGVPAASVLRCGPIARAIVDEADTIGANLIILGANVRPRLSTMLVGSIADQVTRLARGPVLLVHPERVQNGGVRAVRDFTQDAARAGALTRRHLGVRTIEISRIIGSVSRARELGPDFQPRHRRRPGSSGDQRFQRVLDATQRGLVLPPIVVYQLGFGYYVEDGHHRVAAARLNGQTGIDADVTEFVPLEDKQALALFAVRTEFEQATGLAELGAARPETYPVLLRAIRQFARDEQLAELPIATRRWERQVYRPLWGEIRARQLSAAFPGDRTADIVGRVAELRERSGLDWEHALTSIVQAAAHPEPLATGCKVA